MSEHEKRENRDEASAVVVMESAGSGSHKQPYRPTDLQVDSRESHHKRARAPAVPSVSEELKTLSEDSTNENVDVKERMSSHAPSSEKFKQNVSKKLSLTLSKKKASAADTPIPEIELETKVKEPSSPTQPIPQGVATVSGTSVIDKSPETRAGKTEDEDIIEDTEGMRTAGADTKHSEWSDDEEAGGLPRSESRASRLSRAVRHLFCCGVRYEAPSEDDVSTTRCHHSFGV